MKLPQEVYSQVGATKLVKNVWGLVKSRGCGLQFGIGLLRVSSLHNKVETDLCNIPSAPQAMSAAAGNPRPQWNTSMFIELSWEDLKGRSY